MFREKNSEESKSLYRKLALRLHPDHGGSDELMMLLTESYEKRKKDLEADSVFSAFVSDDWIEDIEIFKKDGIFHKVTYDIDKEDIRLRIIEDIKDYADTHKKFKLDYTESIEEYCAEHGYITSRQFNTLVKIYYSFKMDKKEK